MYAREIDGRVLTLRFHPDLLHRNLLLEDLETGSVWSQLGRDAIEGPLTGKVLPLVAAMQTTWADWRTRHPGTLVLEPAWGIYPSYRYVAPRGREAMGLSRFALVLGLELSGEARAYPFEELERAGRVVEDRLAGRVIRIHYDAEARAARAEDEAGGLLPGLTLYWGGWLDFHPGTELWRARPGHEPPAQNGSDSEARRPGPARSSARSSERSTKR